MAPPLPHSPRSAARPLPSPRALWSAVEARDPRSDGAFVYAVETTGIYCRPTCPSRRPARENVRFFATPAGAEAAGFRACKRCRPNCEPSPLQSRIAEACRYIEASDELPSLAVLARRAELSPFHFHRIFKAALGVTPRAYAAACRQTRARKALAATATVTEALHEAGFGSSGRFYAETLPMLGMTPRAFRNGGASTGLSYVVGRCSLGTVLVAQSAKGIAAILIGDTPQPLIDDLKARFPKALITEGEREMQSAISAVIRFVDDPKKGLDLPLDIRGTAFQRKVWEALRRVPAGQTASYTEIARTIGRPKSQRAVAGACAANAIAVAIPCHRVVRSNGDLSGYRWGVERKRRLLAREKP